PTRIESGAAPGHALAGSSGELRRLVVDTMSEGLLAIGGDGTVVDANPAAFRILGRPPSDVLGRPIRRETGLPIDVEGREIAAADVPSVHALTTGEAVRGFVMGVVTPDRGLRWLSVDAIPVEPAVSSGVAVVSTFSDVNEQREAMARLRESEQALRKSEEWLRVTMEAVPDGVVVYSAVRDDAGCIVDFLCEFANGAAAEHEGRPVSEFVGRTFLEQSKNPEAHTYLERWAAVVETGQPLTHEVPRYDALGRVDGAYESKVVKLEDGFLASFRNVTARKRTEQELRASERRLFSFLSELPVGVIVIDVGTGPIFVNARGREVLGREPPQGRSAAERLATYRLYRLDSDEPLELEQTPVHRAITTRSTCTADDLVIRRGDRTVAVSLSATPIFDDDDEIAYVIVVFDDITERRESSERLARALADLERSNEELAEFAAVAAHDLSEPLRVVGGFAELIRRKYGDRLEEEGNDWVDHVLGGVSRMRGLIDDLLTYSRAGSAPLSPQPVELSETVRSVCDSLRFAIAEAAAVVDVGDLPKVVGDPTQLWQVLQNLFANALKFRRPDVAPRIGVTGRSAGAGWEVCVTDNGIGVAPADRDRIFGPFQRLHVPADRPGTGLGLSICRRIVERHGGRLWVEDGPGGGSRFCFTIAARPDAPGGDRAGEASVGAPG
ncbi:MAG TPA: ATP-binding protein, partial [Acidimicrobiia bacterium]|nr:ATP-binding protein [Acidimicrobiia bacterium]